MAGFWIGPDLTGDSRALERPPWSVAPVPGEPTGESRLYVFIILPGEGSNPRKNKQHNKPRRTGKERVMNHTVLCLLPVSDCLASLVDEHAQ